MPSPKVDDQFLKFISQNFLYSFICRHMARDGVHIQFWGEYYALVSKNVSLASHFHMPSFLEFFYPRVREPLDHGIYGKRLKALYVLPSRNLVLLHNKDLGLQFLHASYSKSTLSGPTSTNNRDFKNKKLKIT